MGRGSTKGNENVYFVARKRAAMYNERLYSREGAAAILARLWIPEMIQSVTGVLEMPDEEEDNV